MNETAYNQLIVRLAAGDEEAARRYLLHFPKADRSPTILRKELTSRVAPAVMAFFEQLAPWLTIDELDDTGDRIRRVLKKAGRRGLTRTKLRDQVSGVSAEGLRDAIGGMIRAREVHIELKQTAGRSAHVFRLREFAAGIIPANVMDDPWAYVLPPLD